MTGLAGMFGLLLRFWSRGARLTTARFASPRAASRRINAKQKVRQKRDFRGDFKTCGFSAKNA